MMTTTKNRIQKIVDNSCVLIGVVTSEFPLSDGKVLFKVDTYRPRAMKKEFNNGEGVVDTFYVMTWAGLHSRIAVHDVVRIEGKIDYLNLNSESYGFCPVCGTKQEISNLNNVLVICVGDAGQKVLEHANNYSDGMKKLTKLESYKANNGWLAEAHFDKLEIENVHVTKGLDDCFGQEVTAYDAKVGNNISILVHNGQDMIVSKNVIEDWGNGHYLAKGDIKGTIKNVTAYIAMPWDNQGIDFCRKCAMAFNVQFGTPIFFLQKEPIADELHIIIQG